MFLNVDYSKEIPKPKLKLAKSHNEILTSLYEVEPSISYKLNGINEMSFQIPVFVEDDNPFDEENRGEAYYFPTLVRNPHIDMIHERYLVQVDFNNKIEWFIIIKLDDKVNEDMDSIDVHCYSLGYTLRDSDLKDYTTNSSTLRQILLGNDTDGTKGILHGTQWAVGYIDPKYDKIYKNLENFSGKVLQAILDLSTTFNYIVDFDTENKLLNFYYRENYGKSTGIVFDYNKYLKTLNRSRDADSDVMCTRLYCYGKDGMGIEIYNPTCQPYLDDFSFFMYPFEMDREGKVIKHSNYMSDDLCVAITKYQAKIMQNRGRFFNLYNQKNAYDELLINKNQELFSLNTQLQVYVEKLLVAQSSGNSTEKIIEIKTKIEADIDNKKQEIKQIENVLKNVSEDIDDIKADLSENNNFTNGQLYELYQYVIVDTWEDSKYVDPKDLYMRGLQELAKKSRPKSVLSVDYLNFMECIEEQFMWDELKLGDKIIIQYPLLNINEDFRYDSGEYSPLDEVGDI